MFISLFIVILFSIAFFLFARGIILATKYTSAISKKALTFSLLVCVFCGWHLIGASMFFTFYFGGLAQWGRIEGSHYYLGFGSQLTEVSKHTYWGCYYYFTATELMMAGAIIVACVCYCWNRRRGTSGDNRGRSLI